MTDYDKHIKGLIRLRSEHGTDETDADLTAAIELMRAAAPKDAEAEREHCANKADEMFRVLRPDANSVGWALHAARAAARADGYECGYAEATKGIDAQNRQIAEMQKQPRERELAECKAKLARVEALLKWPECNADYAWRHGIRAALEVK